MPQLRFHLVRDLFTAPAARRRATVALLGACLAVAVAGGAWAADPPAGPIDLNTATQSQLESLKGVGDVTAKKIIAGRPYHSVDDLVAKGVPQRTVDAIRPLVTVGGARPAAAGAAATGAAATTAAAAKVTGGAKSAGSAAMATRPAMPMPTLGGSAAGPGKGLPAAGPIDINSASESELQSLPGIGPATSKAIVAGRPYSSVDDLSKVKGIGPAKIAAMRDLVMAGGAGKATPSVKPASMSAPAPRPAMPAPTPAAVPPPTMPAAPAMPKAPAPTAAPAAPSPAAIAAKAPGQAAAAATKLAPGQRLNINTASAAELEALPGIGPVKAQKIVAGRPYTKVEDIMKVSGIKEGTFAKIKDNITVQ